MVFHKLFYPTKLNTIINDLSAKGRLRPEPIKKLNKHVNVLTLLSLACSVISIYEQSYILAFIILVLFYLMISWHVRITYNSFICFLFSDSREAEVVEFIRNRFIKVRMRDTKDVICIRPQAYLMYVDSDFKIGDSITVLFPKSDLVYKKFLPYPYHNTSLPDLPRLRNHYCLDTNLMK